MSLPRLKTLNIVRNSDPQIFLQCAVLNDSHANKLILPANLEQPNAYGCTPLMVAALYGKIKMCTVLLDAGAHINTTSPSLFNRDALSMAVSNAGTISNTETVQFLIDQGANVNSRQTTGTTILNDAAYFSNISSSIDTVKLLLDNGADIHAANLYGETALTSTVIDGNESSFTTMKLLIRCGANLDHATSSGETLLDHAMTATFAGYAIDWARPWILVCVMEEYACQRKHCMLQILIRLKKIF